VACLTGRWDEGCHSSWTMAMAVPMGLATPCCLSRHRTAAGKVAASTVLVASWHLAFHLRPAVAGASVKEVRLRLIPLTAAAMGVGWEGDDNPAEPSCVPEATGPDQAPKPCFPSDLRDSARERTRQDGVTHPHHAGRRSHV
jgi:hypothetical protein